MRIHLSSAIVMLSLWANAAHALDASKYLACFETLKRDKVSFQGVVVPSQKVVFLPATSGNQRGLVQISDKVQKIKWVADYHSGPFERQSPHQFFKVLPEDGLPELTLQTTYTLKDRGYDMKAPHVFIALAEDNPLKATPSRLVDGAATEKEIVRFLDRAVINAFDGMANSYLPNTSAFYKQIQDTLEMRKTIESAQPNTAVYLKHEGGLFVQKEPAMEILRKHKEKVLLAATFLQRRLLTDEGFDGFNQMVSACSQIKSARVQEKIEAERIEWEKMIDAQIAAIRTIQ